MKKILFGPAGIPLEAEGGTADGISFCRKLGLDAMEVEFVHGVNMKQENAKEAREVSEKNQIKLSCHAPYYINCCAKEEYKIKSSIRHIVSSAQAAYWLSASPIVIHPGYYMNRPKEECKKLVIDTFQKCLEEMDKLQIKKVILGAELTGKKTAYGSLEEIVELSEFFGPDKVLPVLDFAHYHAREKQIKKKQDYADILNLAEKKLGKGFSKNLHIHFSGIEFNEKGEIKHLPVSSDSPPFKPLAEVLKENGWEGKIICESPLLEKDALILQKSYEKVA